jgi:hypothetical protein
MTDGVVWPSMMGVIPNPGVQHLKLQHVPPIDVLEGAHRNWHWPRRGEFDGVVNKVHAFLPKQTFDINKEHKQGLVD